MWRWLAVALFVVANKPPSLADALTLERQGKETEALRELDALVREQPAWELPRLEAGRLRLKLGIELDHAQLDLDAARAIAPENARAQYLWGLLREEEHADDEAMAAYLTALRLRPTYDDARQRLAGIYFAKGDWAKAEAEYRILAERRPEWTSARLQLVTVLEKEGRLDDAVQQLEALHAREPTSKLVTRKLADLYERAGRQEDAQKLRAELSPPTPRKKMRPLKKSRR